MTDREIEFNNGFVTALALFYGHRGGLQEQKRSGWRLLLYGAADHLFDIEYPKNLDGTLKRKIKRFVKNVLEKRLDPISHQESIQFFDQCYHLLMEIDEKYFGLKVEVNFP